MLTITDTHSFLLFTSKSLYLNGHAADALHHFHQKYTLFI